MIKPTVGRVVWFYKGDDYWQGNPLVAFVTYVWNDHVVNVAGFEVDGVPFRRTSVLLLQEGDPEPHRGQSYAEWMPYQQGQAATASDLAPRVAELERIIKGLAENQAAKLAEVMLAEDAKASELSDANKVAIKKAQDGAREFLGGVTLAEGFKLVGPEESIGG